MSKASRDNTATNAISLGAFLVMIASSVGAEESCRSKSVSSPVDRILKLLTPEEKKCSKNFLFGEELLKLDTVYFAVASDDVEYRGQFVNVDGFVGSSAPSIGEGNRGMNQRIYRQKGLSDGGSDLNKLPTLDGYQTLEQP